MNLSGDDPEARAARALRWQVATVQRVGRETRRVKTFRLALPDWQPFRPGQRVDVRLTAADGYQASRSYSIASEPGTKGVIDLTIARSEGGEVSTYFHDELRAGDRIEVRGPIGGPFTWTGDMGGPLLLLAGGVGIVPLMSMLRHREAAARHVVTLLLYSARSRAEVIYRRELERMAAAGEGFEVMYTFTRQSPPGWTGHARRVDEAMVAEAVDRLGAVAHAYVCGPDEFVEAAANGVVAAGIGAERVRTERFGPAGPGE